MTDSVDVRVGDVMMSNFLDFSITSDIFRADDTFYLSAPIEYAPLVEPGDKIQIFINGRIEMTGIIDYTAYRYDKNGAFIEFGGRDYMGLVVDHYLTEFPDTKDISLKQMAEEILYEIPFIQTSNIVFDEGVEKAAGDDLKYVLPQPGDTAFSVLKNYALARGILFFSLPDGTFVFGLPKSKGEPKYFLKSNKEGTGNVISGNLIGDISRRYSYIKIIGQRQSRADLSAEEINVEAEMEGNFVPYFKPYLELSHYDGEYLQRHAETVKNRQAFDSFQLNYTVPGLSLNGVNFSINEIVNVKDDVIGISDNYLIYSRMFSFSKQTAITTISLSELGVIPS